jgi:hypothetical protein
MSMLLLGAGRAALTSPYDPDAATYIAAVEATDGQALETSTRQAIDAFFVGLKADGNLSKLKAACILGGARTLAGSLVPLMATMPAPTNFGFVAGDRSRATGLAGDAASKYLGVNRNTNADPQDNYHQAVYRTSGNTANQVLIGDDGSPTPASNCLIYFSSTIRSRSRNSFATTHGAFSGIGLIGTSRSGATSYTFRCNQSSSSIAVNSQNPRDFATTVYGVPGILSGSRLLYYSVGEAVDLATLESRLNTLAAALATL